MLRGRLTNQTNDILGLAVLGPAELMQRHLDRGRVFALERLSRDFDDTVALLGPFHQGSGNAIGDGAAACDLVNEHQQSWTFASSREGIYSCNTRGEFDGLGWWHRHRWWKVVGD